MSATADAAEAWLRRHRQLTLRARVALVTHALAEWRAWEDDQQRPLAGRAGVRRPDIDRETLEELWARLVDQQGEPGA
jgi:hypothetical protein